MNYHKIKLLLIIQLFAFNAANSQDIISENATNVMSIEKSGYSVEACYRIAEEFLRSSTNQRKAIPYLEYIIKTDSNVAPEVIYLLAQSYYYDSQYDKAVFRLSQYIENEKNGKLKKEAKAELEKYEHARMISVSPLNIALVNLGPQINSRFAEINPFVSKFENLLVYSSKRGQDYNIYVSKKKNNSPFWTKSKLAGNYINTTNDEFVAGLSPSGRDLFVHYNQVSGFEDINMSQRFKGLYRELEDPGTKINSSYREEGACISNSKDTLFFASDRPEGYGGFDIYFSLKLPDGNWGPAINLGNIVNTKLDENYPNLSPDGSKLYFASKGHNTIGGFDIFYTTFDSLTSNWTPPVNLGSPINNAYDNKSIAFTSKSRYAYISTIDNSTLGDYDIYKVIFMDVEPDYLIVKANVFIKEGEEDIPFNAAAMEELSITVFSGDETYGIYAFDKRNNCFVLALGPGEYTLEIQSDSYNTYKGKIKIDENYYKDKHRKMNIYLTPK